MSANNSKGSEFVELDARKMKILQAIIQNYLETGEPVGSRTISKDPELNLSSATIRNEMADLEEMGLILQPHTSAGRIPSDKGYRLYVDNMIAEKEKDLAEREKEVEDMKDFLNKKVDKVEEILQGMAKMLAVNTNYATMISAPPAKLNRLKFIQLSQVEEGKILCVIVMEGNIIKNKIINVDAELDSETILKLNILCNTSLNGLTAQEINLGIISKMTGQAGEQVEVVKSIIEAIAETIGDEEAYEVYTGGTTNIFKYPELSGSEKASELISTFEEKQLLATLADENESENTGTGIQIYIGEENHEQRLKDCSVVTAKYEIEEGVQGTIGIIGPKRMDYEKVVEALKSVQTQLDNVFKKNKD
ncbi:MAG: heat-inducible transcription repressor HrcA [Lachnospiraceae bacterium]|nr:heat-inducible transcription repressor HrcA [Lachnospiraceae bacterium]